MSTNTVDIRFQKQNVKRQLISSDQIDNASANQSTYVTEGYPFTDINDVRTKLNG